MTIEQGWANFSAQGPQSHFKFERAAQQVSKAVSKLDCPAIKMNNLLKSFENIIHSQHGETLHVYNAFIQYQAIRKRE